MLIDWPSSFIAPAPLFQKPSFARDYGINRETAYQYLRHAKLE